MSFEDDEFEFDDIEVNADDRKEHKREGSIELSTYTNFFKAVHSSIYVFTVFALFAVSQGIWSWAEYFLSDWVNFEEAAAKAKSQSQQSEKSNTISPESEKYIITYTCILVIGTVLYLVRSTSFYQMCLRISINLHDMMFFGVTRAKMIFFNNNPSGRVLNRFARDINNVDSTIPDAMFEVIKVQFGNF